MTTPNGYCGFSPTTYEFLYPDASLVGGAVPLWLNYAGGPVREQFSREDGTLMRNAQLHPDQLPPGINPYFTDNGSSSMVVQNQRAIATNAGDDIHLGSGFADADMSIKIIANTSGFAGLIGRISGGSLRDLVVFDASIARLTLRVKTVNQDFGRVWTGTTVIVPGTQYTLRATVVGSVYTFYLNGTLEGTYTLLAGNQQGNSASTTHGFIWDVGAQIWDWYVAKTTNPIADTVNVYNWDGTQVWTSPLSAFSDQSTILIPDSALTQRNSRGPYGWYRVRLTGPDQGDGLTQYGDTAFARIPGSALSAFPPVAHYLTVDDQDGMESPLEGIFGMAACRITITDASVAAATLITTITPYVQHLQQWVVNTSDPAAPHQIMIGFANGIVAHEANVATFVTAMAALGVHVWEGRNEPDGEGYQGLNYNTVEWISFYNTVKGADPLATVLGPCPVSFNAAHQGNASFLFTFSHGPNKPEGWSYHPYNTYQGDLPMIRRNLKVLQETVG